LDEPCRGERGEEVVPQDVDVADRRGRDVVLGVTSRRKGEKGSGLDVSKDGWRLESEDRGAYFRAEGAHGAG